MRGQGPVDAVPEVPLQQCEPNDWTIGPRQMWRHLGRVCPQRLPVKRRWSNQQSWAPSATSVARSNLRSRGRVTSAERITTPLVAQRSGQRPVPWLRSLQSDRSPQDHPLVGAWRPGWGVHRCCTVGDEEAAVYGGHGAVRRRSVAGSPSSAAQNRYVTPTVSRDRDRRDRKTKVLGSTHPRSCASLEGEDLQNEAGMVDIRREVSDEQSRTRGRTRHPADGPRP